MRYERRYRRRGTGNESRWIPEDRIGRFKDRTVIKTAVNENGDENIMAMGMELERKGIEEMDT